MVDILKSLRWQDVADILIVAFIIYHVILLIRGTRAVQMLAGIAVLIVMYFGARELEFMTLYWFLGTFLSSIFLIIIIIFQRDIRRALTQVGQTPFAKTHEETSHVIEEIVGASLSLVRKKLGALIVIERETGLKDYIESGHKVDAHLSKELLVSLFHPTSPLHDGGIVLHKGRILTAGCLLPLTRNPYISKKLGTRHRAAIGLSEETDAVVIIVSEETQQISLAQHGALTSDLNETTLRNRLDAIFIPKEYQRQMLWKSWLSRS
ncbi:MAG: diadenylate cyclase CdaA [Desulfobulbaceae bacterium]|nr:diadenylate cyclase CdaA [Desulfobulbaceae bacterium]